MALTKVTYSMINGEVVNVLDYGADATGSNDSTAAVQAAIDSLPSGGTVYFPDGEFYLETEVELGANITLTGNGNLSILVGPTTGGFIFNQTSKDNITIQNLKFQLNRAKLKFITCDNITITNCYFDGLWNTSNEITQQSLWFGGCNQILVENCSFKDIRDSIYTPTENANLGSINCDNLVVRGCKFWQEFHGLTIQYPTGIYIYYCDNASIYDCEFTNITPATGSAPGYGVYEGDGECVNLTINNCRFTLTETQETMVGILTTQASTALISGCYFNGEMRGFEYGATDTQVTNCNFNKAMAYFAPTSGKTAYKSILLDGNTFVEAYGYGIVVYPGSTTYVETFLMTNNVVRNAVRSGVWIASVTYSSIVGNTFINCNTGNNVDEPKTSGVNFFGGTYLGFVDGNLFQNVSGGAGHMKYGVAIAASTNGINVTQSNQIINMETGSVQNALSAAPSIGTWAKGTKIILWDAVSAGGSEGVVCVTAGTPGTWKTFGSISA